MANKNKEITQKDSVVQAIVVADNFDYEFLPISDSIPHALLPILNRPIIDYTFEFLSLGGVEETYLFCCTHVEAIKRHINKCKQNKDGWTLRMKVNLIVSESCQSFGDCIRDIDAKGLLRGDFVLLEPGTLSNIQLLPLIKQHNDITKHDKGAAMTLVLQEAGVGYMGRCPHEEILIAANDKKRILFHKKLGKTRERKVDFPLEIFLEHPSVSLLHNLKDTHIAICSPSVLPLFSDNFDFQTKDDFVRGLLMNEEILGSTIYCYIAEGHEFGGAVTNWRMYQAISHELKKKWVHPLVGPTRRNRYLKDDVCIGERTKIPENAKLSRVVLGEDITCGQNARIENSFVFANTKIEDNVVVTNSIIGEKCIIKANSKITAGSILGNKTEIDKDSFLENTLVMAEKPDNFNEGEKLGEHAYSLRISNDNEDESMSGVAARLSRLHIYKDDGFDDDPMESEDDFEAFSDSDSEDLSHTQSPAPDDTKMFYMEVIDSLTRGFEDKLLCDNLVLEINSSRYAYNVSVKEVNFNVIKAILSISLKQPIGPQYYPQLLRLLSYFAPVLKNYIRNESAMIDCLQAIEDVAFTNENIDKRWASYLIKHFYDKDYVTEDAILDWFKTLDNKTKFHAHVKPFVDWLNEAEEDSSQDESD